MQSLTTDFKRSKAYPRRQEHWIVVSNPSRQMDTNYIFFVLRFKVLFAKKKTCISGTPDCDKAHHTLSQAGVPQCIILL